MLVSFRCQNFRCFADTGEFELAPITILVGENNSGKSSIIQALHMPSLVLQSEDPAVCLRLLHQDYDYGSYDDLVFKHELERSIVFSFKVEKTDQPDRVEQDVGLPSILHAGLELSYSYLPNRKEIYLSQWKLSDENGPRWDIEPSRYARTKKTTVRGARDSASYLSRFLSRDRLSFRPTMTYEAYDRIKSHFGQEQAGMAMGEFVFLMQATRLIEESFRKVQHIGPLRLPASRTYLYSGEMAHRVGTRGELALRIYSALLKRRTAENQAIINHINESLYQLGFVKFFSAKGVGPRHYEFWTQHDESGLTANLADTGFGASQVLPIIISLFTSDPGSVLLLEQPEIHLHPSAQAELGSVFARACSDQRRIVIETHSENMILRLQTEVARGNLEPKDIAIYYILPDATGHKVLRIPLDNKGRFLAEWPKGFFEEGYRESLELFKRRQGSRDAS